MPRTLKILHVANFSLAKYGASYYSTDRKLSNGLIRNGHLVYDFSYRDVARAEHPFRTTKLGGARLANEKLLAALQNLRPDLLLLGHSELISAETLATARRLLPGLAIALWYVDPLYQEDAIRHVVARAACIDVIFATTGGALLQKLQGTRNRVAFFPNPVDPAIEASRNFAVPRLPVDLLFCGRPASDSSRQETLAGIKTRLATLRFEVWGMAGNPLLLGAAYYEKLAETAMALNLSRRDDVFLYSSDRIAQLTGCGILTFTPNVPGFKALYSGDEIVYFESPGDLIDKVAFFHAHPEARAAMARRGWEKAHGSFDCRRVTRFMLETILQEPYSEPYEWTAERLVSFVPEENPSS